MPTLEPAHWLTLLGMVSSSYVTLGILVWWLSTRFRSVENQQRLMLEAHEHLDQIRHEENLRRFEKISVALARMGSENGTH